LQAGQRGDDLQMAVEFLVRPFHQFMAPTRVRAKPA
jgi:hypothetical protein